MKQEFTLGFIFNKDLDRVLLLKKKRGPKNVEMAGKLNGIGGHLEEGEYPSYGMYRECLEETGLRIPASYWTNFCNLDAEFGLVYCFYTIVSDADMKSYKQLEDEELKVFDLEETRSNVKKVDIEKDITSTEFYFECDINEKWYKNYQRMSNLDWLIPMAINNAQGLDSTKCFEVKETH
jgi:8-oxo-dGTP pyrophosphatase MutT (NUDIX family)